MAIMIRTRRVCKVVAVVAATVAVPLAVFALRIAGAAPGGPLVREPSAPTAAGAGVGALLEVPQVTEVRFDESLLPPGKHGPLPAIPKSWRFVGVSNGEKINCNNLWFQDGDGNIYIARGFNTGSRFILEGSVYKLAAAE